MAEEGSVVSAGAPTHNRVPAVALVPPGQDPLLFLQALRTLWSTRERQQVSVGGCGRPLAVGSVLVGWSPRAPLGLLGAEAQSGGAGSAVTTPILWSTGDLAAGRAHWPLLQGWHDSLSGHWGRVRSSRRRQLWLGGCLVWSPMAWGPCGGSCRLQNVPHYGLCWGAALPQPRGWSTA